MRGRNCQLERSNLVGGVTVGSDAIRTNDHSGDVLSEVEKNSKNEKGFMSADYGKTTKISPLLYVL